MTEEDLKDLENVWISNIIQLIKIGQANGFLGENNKRTGSFSSDTEILDFSFSIQPTNVIKFPERKKK